MSIDRIEQTREVGDYEVTVAVNNPLRIAPIDVLDNRISGVLDSISNLLENEIVEAQKKAEVQDMIHAQELAKAAGEARNAKSEAKKNESSI